MKRDLERDIDSAFLLKALKICNSLTGRLNLDSKGTYSCNDIDRVVHDMIVGKTWIILPDC